MSISVTEAGKGNLRWNEREEGDVCFVSATETRYPEGESLVYKVAPCSLRCCSVAEISKLTLP